MRLLILGCDGLVVHLTETFANDGHTVTVMDTSPDRLDVLPRNPHVKAVLTTDSLMEDLRDVAINHVDTFLAHWGIDKSLAGRGGLLVGGAPQSAPTREIFLLQRKSSRVGMSLGKTTGWIHRTALKQRKVKMLSNCSYEKIDDQGLHLKVGDSSELLEVDSVIICAGQVPARELLQPLKEAGITTQLIGGADDAGELDARRAIDQGTRMAAVV